jgi:hypothetical protein
MFLTSHIDLVQDKVKLFRDIWRISLRKRAGVGWGCGGEEAGWRQIFKAKLRVSVSYP